jgi:hypothetical protein
MTPPSTPNRDRDRERRPDRTRLPDGAPDPRPNRTRDDDADTDDADTDGAFDPDSDPATGPRRRSGSIDVGTLAVEWQLSVTDGTSLVTVHVENTCPRPRRVRVDNLLDGPVRPPRRRGVPEPGWDDEGVTRPVPDGESLSVGYACPAPPATPPVAVCDAPAEGEPETDPVASALRSLGGYAPPRAAVPVDPTRNDDPGSTAGSGSGAGSDAEPRSPDTRSDPATSDTDGDRGQESAAGVGSASSAPGAHPEPTGPRRQSDAAVDASDAAVDTPEAAAVVSDSTAPPTGPTGSSRDAPETMEDADAGSSPTDAAAPSTAATAPPGDGSTTPRPDDAAGRPDDGSVGTTHDDRPVPMAVVAWFDAIDARLDTADRLAGDVPAATPVVAALGGRAGVETLAATLADDTAALRAVAARATALAARAAETEVPDVEAGR